LPRSSHKEGSETVGEWLTINHVKARFGVHAETVSRWVKRDDLGFPKPVKINTRRYWSREEITRWERRRRMLPRVLPTSSDGREEDGASH